MILSLSLLHTHTLHTHTVNGLLTMSSKVFIVTGASRGLGLAIAQTLLRDSHKVFLVARTEKDLKALKEQHPSSVDFIAADLADLTVRERD